MRCLWAGAAFYTWLTLSVDSALSWWGFEGVSSVLEAGFLALSWWILREYSVLCDEGRVPKQSAFVNHWYFWANREASQDRLWTDWKRRTSFQTSRPSVGLCSGLLRVLLPFHLLGPHNSCVILWHSSWLGAQNDFHLHRHRTQSQMSICTPQFSFYKRENEGFESQMSVWGTKRSILVSPHLGCLNFSL